MDADKIRRAVTAHVCQWLAKRLIQKLRQLLQDGQSHISLAFKLDREEEIDRIYAWCISNDTYTPSGQNLSEILLKYELKDEARTLWSMMRNLIDKKQNRLSLLKIDAVFARVEQVISNRFIRGLAEKHQRTFKGLSVIL